MSGAKEAVLDGERHVYDSNDQRMMTELTLEMENLGDHIPTGKNSLPAQGIKLARWGDAFTDALKQRGDEDRRRYGCERSDNGCRLR